MFQLLNATCCMVNELPGDFFYDSHCVWPYLAVLIVYLPIMNVTWCVYDYLPFHVNVSLFLFIFFVSHIGWICQMLRITRHENKQDLRWQNHLQKQTYKTTSKGKGWKKIALMFYKWSITS